MCGLYLCAFKCLMKELNMYPCEHMDEKRIYYMNCQNMCV